MAFLNHLQLTTVANWSKIHADGDKGEDGRKMYSLIQLLAQDYSKGTGANSVYCKFNFSPADIKNLKNIVDMRYNQYQRKFFKVVGQKGQAPFSQCIIERNPELNNPWLVTVSNGTAINAKPDTSTIRTVKQFFSEDGFYDFITSAYSFLNTWEMVFGGRLIMTGYKASQEAILKDQQQNNQNNNNFNNGYNNNYNQNQQNLPYAE